MYKGGKLIFYDHWGAADLHFGFSSGIWDYFNFVAPFARLKMKNRHRE